MFNSPVTEKIAAQNDTISTMAEFIDLVKNPEKITALHELQRQELQMTADQAAKYQEAVEFMAQHEKLETYIREEHEKLEAANADLAKRESAHKESSEAEISRLEEQRAAQEQKDHEQAALDKKMQDDWRDLQRKYSEAISPIDARTAQNEKDRLANEQEADRLAKLAKKLESRLAKLQAVSADDDEVAV